MTLYQGDGLQLGISIDLRMYRMAGIGRYLQTLMPEVVPHLTARRIRILGDPAELAGEPWMGDHRLELRSFRAPIFSVSEQVQSIAAIQGGDLLWAPQYNIPLLHRGMLVVTIHDLCQLAHPDSLGSDLQRWYARHLLSVVARRASAILCVSEFTRQEIEQYLHVKKERLFVTYPGRGLDINSVRGAESHYSGPRYLLAVGNVKAHKNLRRLVEAFARVRDRIPHELLIVGKREGMLNADLTFKGASTLLEGRIRFTGHISDEELRGLYQNATALVFPSLYEGFGFPALEAMSQGCPVACSNVASLPEIVGDAALLFDPMSIDAIAEAIVKITCDMDLRRKLIYCGHRRVTQFDARVCGRRTAAVINAVLSGNVAHQDKMI